MLFYYTFSFIKNTKELKLNFETLGQISVEIRV